jgi:hypothetical protein
VVNVFSVEVDPYDVLVPYFTSEVVAWSVVHAIVSDVVETVVTVTFEITGAAAVPVVVNVVLPDVAEVPLPFADTTSKSYNVPAVNPVSVTVWLVTSAVFTVVAVPYADVVP